MVEIEEIRVCVCRAGVEATSSCDLANDVQDEVLSHEVGWHLTVQYKPKCGRHLHQRRNLFSCKLASLS